MELYEMEENEFRNFLDQHKLKTFLQTPEIGELRKKQGWDIYYLGLKDKNKVVAGTMLMSKKRFLGKKLFYAPRGFLCDFENTNHVQNFTLKLKQFVKSHDGYVLRIDPYISIRQRDIDGKVVPDGIDHSNILEHLKKLGYRPSNQSEQIKWMFALDIKDKTSEQVMKEMKSNTRNIIKKTMKEGIVVRELSYEELEKFKDLTKETSERKNFSDKPLSYYQTMYQLFYDKKQLKYIIAEIHFSEYIDALNRELEFEQAKKNKLTLASANDGKRKELEITINSLQKKIKEAENLKKEHGEILILSGGMFILYGDEVIYLFSGNYKKYMQFNAQYRIQWEMIQYAIKHQFKRYNFYGITGNFDKNDKDYGMYEFKKGFNGYVIELIGELELPISPYYFLHQMLSKWKHRLKK